MMTSLTDKFENEHPEIYAYVGDERRLISGDEREQIIAEWARNLIDAAWVSLRRERDGLLAASDWTQAADAPVDAEAWAAYRQTLRDLPAKIKDPTAEIKWPEPPK